MGKFERRYIEPWNRTYNLHGRSKTKKSDTFGMDAIQICTEIYNHSHSILQHFTFERKKKRRRIEYFAIDIHQVALRLAALKVAVVALTFITTLLIAVHPIRMNVVATNVHEELVKLDEPKRRKNN